MTSIIRSEFRKIRTTRTAWILLAGLLVTIALAISEPLLNVPRGMFRGPITEQDHLLIPQGLVITVFALLVGLRSFTDEFRYGSIVSTLLGSPVRERVLLAKVVASATLGFVYALGASLAALGISVVYFAINDIDVVASVGGLIEWCFRFGTFGLLWASIGVGVGLAVKHQLPAIAGALFWVLVGEAFLSSIVGDLARFFATFAGIAILAGGPEGAGPVEGTTILAGWAAVALAAGVIMMRRRDIT